jgi:hypothetical protein
MHVASRDASRLADAGVIAQLWRDFDDLGSLERNVVDSSGKSAEEAAAEVAQRLSLDPPVVSGGERRMTS